MNQDGLGDPSPTAATAPTPPGPVSMSEADARTWAMFAHLTVLLNLVTVFLGMVAALVIYFVFRERSRYVAFQALQAFVFQLIFWVGGGLAISLIWAITGALSAVLIGILCVPLALILTVALGLMPVVALVYGVYGALEANQGQPFRYWLIGGWVRNIVPA